MHSEVKYEIICQKQNTHWHEYIVYQPDRSVAREKKPHLSPVYEPLLKS